jgi:hypothetical protein
MKTRLLILAVAAGLALPAAAWWPQGHSILTEAAVRALPEEVPAYFREGHGLAAHLAQDPDVAKNRDAPNAQDAETPEHYIDWELLGGRTLPTTRYAFLRLCAEAKLDPKAIGTLPYSVTEWTERLTLAFAEHRKWPENPHIRTKSLVYAGILAHYAGDLCMPLHCTIHFNGRARPDGTSPNSGIHARVDSLIEKVGLKPADLAREQKPEAYPRLLPAVLAEIERSRALVDRVYELEAKLPPERGEWKPEPEVVAFTEERGRAATRFLGSLYLSAWRNSHGVRLPVWLER